MKILLSITLVVLLFIGCKERTPPYTAGWQDGYLRALKQNNLGYDMNKVHEGYSIDSANYVNQ